MQRNRDPGIVKGASAAHHEIKVLERHPFHRLVKESSGGCRAFCCCCDVKEVNRINQRRMMRLALSYSLTHLDLDRNPVKFTLKCLPSLFKSRRITRIEILIIYRLNYKVEGSLAFII